MCDRCMELEQRIKDAESVIEANNAYFEDLSKALAYRYRNVQYLTEAIRYQERQIKGFLASHGMFDGDIRVLLGSWSVERKQALKGHGL